jgi:hypothetical protein
MLAYRHADIRQLNDLARTHMHAGGHLTGPSLDVTDDELGDRTFQTADHVLLKRNNHQLGIRNGDIAIVHSVNPDDGSVTVTLARGGHVQLPHHYIAQHALSRHRDTCHLYLSDADEVFDDREHSHVRQPSRSMSSALEISRADRAAFSHTRGGR